MATINVNGKRFNISSLLSPLQQQKEVAGSYAERTVLSTMIYDPEYASTWNNLIDLELFEKQCIRRWRQMSLNNYIDFAIQNIVCEILTLDDQSAFPIEMDLSQTNFSEKIKSKLHDCFDRIMKLLHFVNKPYQILQQWYIDGKCYFFLNRDKNGDIISIEMLDPLRIINYIERKDSSDPASEFRRKYHYQDMTCQQVVLEIDERDMLMVPSGIQDNLHRIWVSYLDKAYIPLNQLTNMEDAILIYRLARAPERRVFYIDVGELSKSKAEEYMQEVIGNLRNTMEFDKETGTIAEKRKHTNILEDIFLARRSGTNTTSVETLPGGQANANISDLDYFLQKLFRSLNVPFTRWNEGSGGANALGRATEINRDELLFTKFISRLRIHFNILFYNLIKKINEVENIIDIDDLEENFESINFIWNTTNMFFELKNLDILNERMNALEKIMPYSGRFFSIKWIRKNILNQTDEEIAEIEKDMESEKELMKSWSPGADDFTQETRDADHTALGFDPNNLDNSGDIEQDSAGDPLINNNYENGSFNGGKSKQQVEPKWVSSDEKEGVMKMPPRITIPPILDIDKSKKKEDK